MLDKENIFSRGKKLCEYGLVKGTGRGGGAEGKDAVIGSESRFTKSKYIF